MASLDRDKTHKYLAEIKEAREVLARIVSENVDEYLGDPLKIRALKYTLIVLVEAISNTCRHILAKKTQTAVEEYMEAILKMKETGLLSKAVADQLVPLTKLRHQLIHGYWKTDDRRLFTETKTSLGVIDQFISEISHLMTNSA